MASFSCAQFGRLESIFALDATVIWGPDDSLSLPIIVVEACPFFGSIEGFVGIKLVD